MDKVLAPAKPLIRIRESASLQEAAQLMCDLAMGALGVEDADHRFVGLITERDVMWATAQGKDPASTQVEDIVNDFPVMIPGPVTADRAADTMLSAHVRHLLIKHLNDIRITSMRDLIGVWRRDAISHDVSRSELKKMFGASFAGKCK